MTDATPLDNPVVFAERVLRVTPHARQCEFLLDDHPLQVVVGGRRAGKTHALAVLLVWQLVRHRVLEQPFRALVAAPVMDQARLLLHSAIELLKASPLRTLITATRITPFPEIHLGDDVVLFVRATAEEGKSLRGHSADLVVLDEAGYVPERTITEALTPLLADRPGGRMVLASTPTTLGSYLHTMFERGRVIGDPRVRSFHFPSMENPHLDAEYVRAQATELPERVWRVEFAGEFLDQRDAVFRFEDVQSVARGAATEPIPGRTYVVGWDPAKQRDRSGVVVVDVTEVPWQVVHIADQRGEDYGAQVRRVAALAARYNDARVMVDQTGQGAVFVDLLRQEGASAQGVTFTAGLKADMVAGLAVLIERREITFPPEPMLLEELRWYEARVTSSGHVAYGAPEGGRIADDIVTALMLAVKGAGGPAAARPSDPLAMPFLLSAYAPFPEPQGVLVARRGELPDVWLPSALGPWR